MLIESNEFSELLEIEKRRAVEAYQHSLADQIRTYIQEAKELHNVPMSIELGEGYRMVHEDLLAILVRSGVSETQP